MEANLESWISMNELDQPEISWLWAQNSVVENGEGLDQVLRVVMKKKK